MGPVWKRTDRAEVEKGTRKRKRNMVESVKENNEKKVENENWIVDVREIQRTSKVKRN